MTRLSWSEAKALAKTGERGGTAPSTWNGAVGLVVDASYTLPNGDTLDLTCLNGWIYEGRLYSKDEATARNNTCPQNVRMEWGSGY